MSFRVERRFNLLILEEGEEYVADVSATMALVRRGQSAESKGRLRVGSKGLVFQPDEVSASILKFPFRHIKSIGSVDESSGGFPMECEQLVQVATKTGAETRIVQAFTILKSKRAVAFQVHYASAQEFLQLIRRLRDAVSLQAEIAETVVRGILSEVTADVYFDMSRLGHREVALLPGHLWVRRVKPLLEVRGMLQISDEAVYFQPHPNFSSNPVNRIPRSDVLHVFQRIYGLQANAVEIITVSGSCLYLCFEDPGDCDRVISILNGRRRSYPSPVASPGFSEDILSDVRKITGMWQSGLLSNFHYIDFLNCAAGRSQNDFSQYPVFPWVLQDYTSSVLDLTSESVYRDLSRPIGALSAKRLESLKARMDGMPEDEKFLYGTHYSTPAYVIHWLLRKMPERMLRLHSGHFDSLPRIFRSIVESWETVNESSASLMELIPEFFVLPAPWLTNDLGISTPEGILADVGLPRWADSTEDLICKLRAALESEHVSTHLPGWIDLIFGFKQRGPEALRSDNLFHPVCYSGDAAAQGVSGLARKVLETQLQEFGRVPAQLFTEPHPPRLKIPRWEANQLRENSSHSEPWYKAVWQISGSVSPSTVQETVVESAKPFAPGASFTPASRRANVVVAKDPVDDQAKGAKCVRSFMPQPRAPIITTGQIASAKCCHQNMYIVGEDGCLRVNCLSKQEENPSISTASMRKNFRISPLPLSAVTALETDLVAVGGHDNSVTLYSSSRGSALAKSHVHADTVTCLGVGSSTRLLVSGSRDQTVRTWSFANSTLKNEETFDDMQQPVLCTAVAGNLVLAGATDGQLVAWDVRSGNPILDRELNGSVLACALHHNEHFAMALDATGDLKLWDLRRHCESVRLSVCSESSAGTLQRATCFLSDFTQYVVVGGLGPGSCPSVSLWDITEQRELRTWTVSSDGDDEVQHLVQPPPAVAGSADAKGGISPFYSITSAGIVHAFA